MTSKIKALWLAIAAAITGILSYIAELPPSLQTEFTQLFPEAYRGQIGICLRVLTGLLAVYATHQASHSGPATPPANSPQS